MNILLGLVLIIAIGFVLHILIKQTYNLVFFTLNRPVAWIVICGFVSFLTWLISYLFELNISIPSLATTIALLSSLPPKVQDGHLQKEMDKIADELYESVGIKNGRKLYRVGLVVFLAVAIISWIVFYGDIRSV